MPLHARSMSVNWAQTGKWPEQEREGQKNNCNTHIYNLSHRVRVFKTGHRGQFLQIGYM